MRHVLGAGRRGSGRPESPPSATASHECRSGADAVQAEQFARHLKSRDLVAPVLGRDAGLEEAGAHGEQRLEPIPGVKTASRRALSVRREAMSWSMRCMSQSDRPTGRHSSRAGCSWSRRLCRVDSRGAPERRAEAEPGRQYRSSLIDLKRLRRVQDCRRLNAQLTYIRPSVPALGTVATCHHRLGEPRAGGLVAEQRASVAPIDLNGLRYTSYRPRIDSARPSGRTSTDGPSRSGRALARSAAGCRCPCTCMMPFCESVSATTAPATRSSRGTTVVPPGTLDVLERGSNCSSTRSTRPARARCTSAGLADLPVRRRAQATDAHAARRFEFAPVPVLDRDRPADGHHRATGAPEGPGLQASWASGAGLRPRRAEGGPSHPAREQVGR